MKINFISALLLACAATASHVAFAADGTITFTGKVSAQTCTINKTSAANFTVTLPPVSANALASAGQTAGRAPFKIALTGCSVKSGTVRAYFEPGSTVNTSTGQLVLNSGADAATNVEIGLLNSDLSVIDIGAADGSQNSQAATISAAGDATLNFYAQYVATGAATAGTAQSSVMYTLVYP
ncbi:Major fimbrial subunit SMF-1 [Burkholderia gladioli]|uniref:fimbrial protein n=1 Tax=Burkholderia gladioli TaxID=28095 RepID=UPI0009B79AC1|nr:fimbrial protein [Burkholderia gladioli]CAG9210157.1 Major fimbrial subunit SMF-1 [Burkholderia gladioli]